MQSRYPTRNRLSLVFILAECRNRDERKKASLEVSRFVIVNLEPFAIRRSSSQSKVFNFLQKGSTRDQTAFAVSSNQRSYFHTPCSLVFQAAGDPRRDSSSCTFPGRVIERGCSAAPACQNVLIFDGRSLRNILDRSVKESKDSVRRGPPSGVGKVRGWDLRQTSGSVPGNPWICKCSPCFCRGHAAAVRRPPPVRMF